jgi:hypothetical protein
VHASIRYLVTANSAQWEASMWTPPMPRLHDDTVLLCTELEAIGLSAVQQVELDCVQQLARGNDDERRQSIKQLAQLPVCEATQQAVAACLKDEELTVRFVLLCLSPRPCKKIGTCMPMYI